MTHASKPLSLAAATFALVGAVAGAAQAAPVPTTELRPAALARGADSTVPHLEGRTIVDGDVRVKVATRRLSLLGPSGRAYVVTTENARGVSRIERVRPDGARRTLATRVESFSAVLSADGERVMQTRAVAGSGDGSTVTVWSARTGKVLARRHFASFLSALDLAGPRVLLARNDAPYGSFVLDTRTGKRTPAAPGLTYLADLSAGLVASYTKDPYDGGCSVLRRIAKPGVLWRSCRERLDTVSPDGRRISTIPLLSDGLGPRTVTVRSVRGVAQARYTTPGWFGLVEWESPTTLLLDTNGSTKQAVVRCVLAACERASDLAPVENP